MQTCPPFLRGVVQQVDDGGFEPGKAEIVRRAVHCGLRQTKGLRVAPLRYAVQLDAARIGHPYGARRLVKRLARRIVPGTAQHVEPGVIIHTDNMAHCPPETTRQRKGGFQLRAGDIVGRDMSAQVMYGNQGLAPPAPIPWQS